METNLLKMKRLDQVVVRPESGGGGTAINLAAGGGADHAVRETTCLCLC